MFKTPDVVRKLDETTPDIGKEMDSQHPLMESGVIEQELKCILPDEFNDKGSDPKGKREELSSDENDEAERLRDIHSKIHKLDTPLTALCLSGGGIRSATFCLGVLQSLARKDQLRDFHYLSTVSGGGYIGSWLSRWISWAGLDTVTQAMKGHEPEAVTNLRSYSNYLAPRRGLSTDTLSLAVHYFRNLSLTWLVLLPFLLALLLLPHVSLRIFTTAMATNGLMPSGVFPYLVPGVIVLSAGVFLVAMSLPVSRGWRIPNPLLQKSCPFLLIVAAFFLSLVSCRAGKSFAFSYLLLVSIIIHIPALLGIIVRYLLQKPRQTRDDDANSTWFMDVLLLVVGLATSLFATAGAFWLGSSVVFFCPTGKAALARSMLFATFSVPYALFSYFAVGTLWLAATARFRRSTEADREWLGASCGLALAIAAGWLFLHFVVYYLPVYVLRLGGFSAMALAGAGSLSGILASLGGYWSKFASISGAGNHNRLRDLAAQWGLKIGALFFIVFVLGVGGSLLVDGLLKKIPVYSSPSIEDDGYVRKTGSDGRENEEGSSYVQAIMSLKNRLKDATQAMFEDATLDQASKGAVTKAFNDTVQQQAQELVARLAREEPTARFLSATNLYSEQSGKRHLDATTEWKVLWTVFLVLIGLLLWAIVFSVPIGVNRFSLHSVYTNRLVRAYLGASRRVGGPTPPEPDPLSGFDDGDNEYMSRLAGGNKSPFKEGPVRLFHVVNTTLNLMHGTRLEWQQRKGGSFTVSPLHAGSWMLGYQEVDRYGGDHGLRLGKAMGISGAAASPNMGYHSSKLIAFVMTFFNVRLGWWMPNPSSHGEKVWREKEPALGIGPLISEGLGRTTEKSRFVYLSDGGHFDNLGLYEMVRRRCTRIFVVDASADPDYLYSDLAITARKIRVDLGIRVEFPDRSGPARQLPPKGPYTFGQIFYSDVDGPDARDGVLIYVKPILTGNEPVDVEQYARKHGKDSDRFPHQSTMDQFFDEEQFESYRALGEYMGTRVINKIGSIQRLKRVDLEAVTANEPTPVQSVPREGGLELASGQSSGGSIGETARRLLQSGSAGSAIHALQSWGGIMTLGAALTAGGIVGVGGTLALRDSQASLQKPGWEIGLNSESIPKEIPLVLKPPETVQQLEERVKNLNVALESLTYTIWHIPPRDRDQLTGKIARLTGAVDTLSLKLGEMKIDEEKLSHIQRELSGLKERLRVLEDIAGLKGEIKLLAPKRNVKASGGGR